MADKLAVIQSQETIAELEAINKQTLELIGTFNQLVAVSKDVSSGLTKGTPKDFIASEKQLVAIQKQKAQVLKELAEAEKRLEAVNTQSARTRQANANAENAEIRLKQQKLRLSAQEEKAAQQLSSAYERLNKQHIEARKHARDMGVQHGILSKEFLTAAAAANQYDQQLKQVDVALGQYSRNVGNYGGTMWGLNAQMAQVLREMPNFAIDARIGIMSLSNNLPYLADAIADVNRQAKSMKEEFKAASLIAKEKAVSDALAAGASEKVAIAEGKKAQALVMSNYQMSKAAPLWKQMIGSVLNWQTLLIVGISAVMMYNKEITNFFSSLFNGTKTIDLATEKQLSLSEAYKSTDYKTAIRNISEMRSALDLARSGVINKEKALLFYNETLGKAMGSAKNLNDVEEILTKNAEKYIKATLLKAAANLALDKAAEAAIKAEEARQKKLEDYNNAFTDATIRQIRTQDDFDKEQERIKNNRIRRQKEEIKANEDARKAQEKIAKSLLKQAAEVSSGMNFDVIGSGYEPVKIKSKDITSTGRNVSDIENADRKAYNAQKRLLDDELKLLEQNLENKLKIAKEDPYLSNVEKITEQVSIYSQLIDANENYYDRLIQAARKYNQETESLQSQRMLKNNTLTDASDNVMIGMPRAIKDDIEYQRELQDLIIEAGNAEDRRRIIANSTLSIKQKERLLAIQEIEDERELLELQKERLLEDVARLSPMYLSGTLTREQRKEWETVNKQLEEVGENLEKNKTILEQTKVNALKDDLAPLIGLISGSLGGAGDSFTSALDAILNKQSTMMDKFVASAKFAGDLLTEFFRNQADARIAELDRQLEYSRQATETELSFVEQRFEVLNAMSELTEEQNQERLALEDEARVIKEQQHLREKQIEAERLRAQQRAQAQQAIINGLLAATQTLAQTGATPLGWGLAAAAAAFGVAQAVAIMSKNPVPEYFKGRDGGQAEWAITQDRYGAEAISDKHGNIKTWGTDSGAKLTWLDDGDRVHTAAETKQLMSRLAQKGTPNINILHNDNPVDYDKLADKVGSRFEKVLRKFDKVTFTEDERGNIFMQEAGKIPVFKGRKKQQPIKINIKGNDRN